MAWAGRRVDERFHDVEVPEHRRGEDRRTCAVRDHILGDFAIADVRRGAERRFPVAEAPVPRRLGEGLLAVDEFLDALHVAVRDRHHLAHERGILGRKGVSGLGGCGVHRHRKFGGHDGRASQEKQTTREHRHLDLLVLAHWTTDHPPEPHQRR
ncbi:MAG: hypothetical protein AUH72_16525 [Acidobacteria bacterium 13_1_40CM_4_65_8]|nr:MAG: hypothetical protein AUH72_16525 [Acidobacteria bacterium 13_1_40CM_4_65_8]